MINEEFISSEIAVFVRAIMEYRLNPETLTADRRGELAARASACLRDVERERPRRFKKKEKADIEAWAQALTNTLSMLHAARVTGDVDTPDDLRAAALEAEGETPAIRAARVGFLTDEGDTPAIDALEADLLSLKPARITCKTRPRSGKDFKLNTEG